MAGAGIDVNEFDATFLTRLTITALRPTPRALPEAKASTTRQATQRAQADSSSNEPNRGACAQALTAPTSARPSVGLELTHTRKQSPDQGRWSIHRTDAEKMLRHPVDDSDVPRASRMCRLLQGGLPAVDPGRLCRAVHVRAYAPGARSVAAVRLDGGRESQSSNLGRIPWS
jgi:hypothetical protein